MPSVATGAVVSNRKMIAIGVSGDGDTGAIGIGQFVHLMRRNLPMIYIIEDNGCYGLTKGQFSPTADLGSTLKTGVVNDLPPIDTCALAIELGASFVARSFSGDPKQLKAILKAALSHRGTCMIDVLSPCVTFNDHDGSTKSYSYAKDHEEPLGRRQLRAVLRGHQHRLRSGHDDGGDAAQRIEAAAEQAGRGLQPDRQACGRCACCTRRRARGEFATGILYVEPDKQDFIELLGLVDEPLASPRHRTHAAGQGGARRDHGELPLGDPG